MIGRKVEHFNVIRQSLNDNQGFERGRSGAVISATADGNLDRLITSHIGEREKQEDANSSDFHQRL
jgi:hypothetical protein